jgi:hypothetical protein
MPQVSILSSRPALAGGVEREHCVGIEPIFSKCVHRRDGDILRRAVDGDPQPVRRFSTFTEDLMAAADWLKRCAIKTVAMESTGVYWIPLFQILEARGMEVCLVNARHVKNVPGRKSDVCDCQWLQHLHSAGLLRASFWL